MIKSSEMNLDLLVQNITDNEMGITLIEADVYAFIDILAKGVAPEDRLGLFGNSQRISCHVFPILYKNPSGRNIDTDLAKCRMMAVQNIFNRWSSLGYNTRKAKSPFGSKKFNKFLEEIEYLKADYVLLMVE